MTKKIDLVAEFKNPLSADDAISNLTEAGYKPKLTKKDGKVIIIVPVDQNSLESAKETITDAKADSITQKTINK